MLGMCNGQKGYICLVSLADKVLGLNKRLASFGDASSKEKDEVSNKINRTTDEIDERIYELYGITEKEKQAIETTLATTLRI